MSESSERTAGSHLIPHYKHVLPQKRKLTSSSWFATGQCSQQRLCQKGWEQITSTYTRGSSNIHSFFLGRGWFLYNLTTPARSQAWIRNNKHRLRTCRNHPKEQQVQVYAWCRITSSSAKKSKVHFELVCDCMVFPVAALSKKGEDRPTSNTS